MPLGLVYYLCDLLKNIYNRGCLVVANHKFPVFTVEGEHPVEVYEYRYTDGGWEDRDANHDGTCLSANLLVGLGF